MKSGTFYTTRIQNKEVPSDPSILKVFGVRIAKFLPLGWSHWDGLTPSKDLLFAAKNYERNGTWNKETFNDFYLPLFLQEILRSVKAKEELKKIQEVLNDGRDVYYACYCKNPHLCHRGILADLFEKYGYNVEKK